MEIPKRPKPPECRIDCGWCRRVLVESEFKKHECLPLRIGRLFRECSYRKVISWILLAIAAIPIVVLLLATCVLLVAVLLCLTPAVLVAPKQELRYSKNTIKVGRGS